MNEPQGSEPSSTEPECQHPDNDPCDRRLMGRAYYIKCGCGHVQDEHRTFTEGGCTNCRCKSFALPPAEPPLTPGEEEQAPEDGGRPCTCSSRTEDVEGSVVHDEDCDALREPWPCGDCGAMVPASKDWCTAPACQEKARAALAAEAPPPPQPERRPPYAVAYSVQGHLYAVTVPGDAMVRAVDGALVIAHHLGPVAGIVHVNPIEINEEGA
ncbi:hypothetical protein AB0942_33370 [Streptomyces nodosus]|uniref:hypothetical protein n=1 Tax=Streptomyces nodosus TaxID=40318 RepID=UPI0034572ECA